MIEISQKTKPRLARLFSARPHTIEAWFTQKGYTGELSDKMLSYFSSKSGLAGDHTLYDHIVTTLTGLGYTGNLQSQLNTFFDAQVGSVGTRSDNEIAFWHNFTLDFGSSIPAGAMQDDSGNYLKDDSGNYIIGS